MSLAVHRTQCPSQKPASAVCATRYRGRPKTAACASRCAPLQAAQCSKRQPSTRVMHAARHVTLLDGGYSTGTATSSKRAAQQRCIGRSSSREEAADQIRKKKKKTTTKYSFTEKDQETEVPSSLESKDDLTFQHSNQTNVRQVGKFQPRTCSQKKAKSVSFILPDGSNSGTLAESFSVNPSTRNSEEHGLPKVLEDVDTEPQYQDVLELEQQILEDRTNSENSGDAGANISTMTLRKRRSQK
ncbi:hypothetical protein Cni_G18230 [Canna indica]|uniref:Uncharacterized protein n=1 Tax=Canna indica TaxID=4628 RepID=A0AAQ3KIY3_9LILI|nr:hypothetical protein Cni_G18230 [Canna indica]